MSMEYISPLGSLNSSINGSLPGNPKVTMSQRRVSEGTSVDDLPQQATANYWNNVPVPTWVGPLAYYNEDMEGRFRTGLSLANDPGFHNQLSQHESTSIEDTLFEINQTGLSPMWRDPSPAYVDLRVGRPALQGRQPLPFQYVSEPPPTPMPANTNAISWDSPGVDVHMRGRGPASSTARQTTLYQSLMGQPAPAETSGTATPVPASPGYSTPQYPTYPPYPGPLVLSTAPPYPGPLTLPTAGPTAYDIMQQQEPQTPTGTTTTTPAPILVQLGASQNFLVNNRPARWIQVLDVDPSYQRARTPSPHRSPALNLYVRAPETEVHYWAVFLRALTVPELIKRVVNKYGFSDDERDRVRIAVRVTGDNNNNNNNNNNDHAAARGGGGDAVRGGNNGRGGNHGGNNGGGGRGGGNGGGNGGNGGLLTLHRLTDEDVRAMETESAMDVRVTSLEGGSEDWQLELRF